VLENPRDRCTVAFARRIDIGNLAERLDRSHRKAGLLTRFAYRGLYDGFAGLDVALG
jgi:hypothetical protein